MLKLAIKGMEKFSISTLELNIIDEGGVLRRSRRRNGQLLSLRGR
jgi:hypothetical protein